MPSSDTSYSSPSSMCLLLQMFDTISLDHTSNSLSFCHTNHVDVLILLEHLIDSNFLLQQSLGIIHLLFNCSTINLDFEDVILLLSEVQFVHLGVGNNSHYLTIFDDSLQLNLDVLAILVLLGMLSEGLLLWVHPILVESSQGVLSQLAGPHCGQSSQTSGGFDVTHNTHNGDGRSLHNGDWLNDLLAIQFWSWSVHGTQDVGHTCLKSGKGSQMHRLSSIVLREWSDSASEVLRPLSGGEPKMSMSRSFVLSVRH